MTSHEKPLIWLRGKIEVPPFTRSAALKAGYFLRRLQLGERLAMPVSRPMQIIGKRCHELRIPDAFNTWRILYRTDPDAVLILAVFSRKSQVTPKRILRACTRRAKEYDREQG